MLILVWALMVPMALAWTTAFLLFRRRRVARVALVLLLFLAGLAASWPASILFAAPALGAMVIALAAFEWAAVKEPR